MEKLFFSVPARIMSFSRDIITPWKQNLTLPCRKVGAPVPMTTWRMRNKPIEKTNRRQVGELGKFPVKPV